MAQAMVKRTVKKMMMMMTIGAKSNDSPSKLLLGMSSSPSKSYSRIPQLTTAKIIIPSHFSPTTTSQLYPCSSFYTARKMSSESAFQKAWAFAVTQRAEALARAQDIMGATSKRIQEITEHPTATKIWDGFGILESVTDKLFAFALIFMCIQWMRTMVTKADTKVLAHNPYHLLLEFKLNRYVDNSKADVTLLDGEKVCVVYLRHTHFYSPSRIEHKVLTHKLPEGRYDGAKIVTWFDKQRKSMMVEIFSVKPATKVSLIQHHVQ